MEDKDCGRSPLAFVGPYGVFIHHCDCNPRRRGWSIPQRRLECWLLVTSLEGTERVCVDGAWHDIRPGDSYLVPPGALHDLGSRAGNTPVWAHFDLLFDAQRSAPRHWAGPYDRELGARAVHLQPDARRLFGIELPVVVPPPLDAIVRVEFPALVRQHREGPGGRLLAAARLQVLIARLAAQALQHGPAAGEGDAACLAQAEAVARQRLDTGFGLAAFAAAAGLGRSRFCQLYVRLRGEPPGAFLRRERLARAEALLRGTDLPLAQVAQLVGYREATVFVRAFRRARGVTPGAWRGGRSR